MLGRQGIVNSALLGMGVIDTPLRLLYTEGGVVAALTQVQMPLMVLPLSLPGIIAGCLLTFTAAVTAFITQSLVGGGQMLFMPAYVLQQALALGDMPFASAVSVIFLLSVLVVVAALTALGRRVRGYA